MAALLRVPLRAKLSGANALLFLAAAIIVFAHGGAVSRTELLFTIALVLLGGLLLNIAILHLAREERSRIRELAAQVIRAGDEERARIARELHDSTAQTLAALVLQTSSALKLASESELHAQLEIVHAHAVDALEEVRALSHTVHPRVLDDLGLAPALATLARRTRVAHEIDVTVEMMGDPSGLPAPLRSALYTIAHEALTNAVKHGAPRSIRILVVVSSEDVRIEISDDGPGFDPQRSGRRQAASGLFVMSERTALVDGALHIDSSPGRGARIVATIPIALATENSRS